MNKRQVSMQDALKKELKQFKTDSRDEDLFDLISECSSAANWFGSEEGWTNLGRQPNPKEIDCSRTPEEMILGNRAILRGGRKIYWTDS